MPTFPASPPPAFPLDEELSKPQVRSQFEAGYVHSRPRFSKSRSIWNLRWKSITEADYQIIRTFFLDNVGLLFDWVNPADGVTYKVRFSEDSLKSSRTVNNLRQLSTILEQE